MNILKPVNGRLSLSHRTCESVEPRRLTLALSVQASEFRDRFDWAVTNDFALEYTPDPTKPELIRGHVTPFVEAGIPVRFHCRFGSFELGNSDAAEAEKALKTHTRVIDEMSNLGEPVVGVHLNLSQKVPFDADTGLRNLVKLVAYADKRNIIVNLENLRRGPSSDPRNILRWANESGAMITIDIGHAVESEIVTTGEMTTADIIEMFKDRLNEVHMYGRETDRHYPIENMDQHGTFVDRLLETRCEWWTIELDNYGEALNTKKLLLNYLSGK